MTFEVRPHYIHFRYVRRPSPRTRCAEASAPRSRSNMRQARAMSRTCPCAARGGRAASALPRSRAIAQPRTSHLARSGALSWPLLSRTAQPRPPPPLRAACTSAPCAYAFQLNQQHQQRVCDELCLQPQLATPVKGAMCLAPNRESGAPAQTFLRIDGWGREHGPRRWEWLGYVPWKLLQHLPTTTCPTRWSHPARWSGGRFDTLRGDEGPSFSRAFDRAASRSSRRHARGACASRRPIGWCRPTTTARARGTLVSATIVRDRRS